jgi:hypothetical protein
VVVASRVALPVVEAAAVEVAAAQAVRPEAAQGEAEAVQAAQPEVVQEAAVAVEQADVPPAEEPVAAGVRVVVQRAARPQAVEAARQADAHREGARRAVVRLSAAPSSVVRAGPDPAGPGQRRSCRRWALHGPARRLVRATASLRSPSLPAEQYQFASSETSPVVTPMNLRVSAQSIGSNQSVARSLQGAIDGCNKAHGRSYFNRDLAQFTVRSLTIVLTLRWYFARLRGLDRILRRHRKLGRRSAGRNSGRWRRWLGHRRLRHFFRHLWF